MGSININAVGPETWTGCIGVKRVVNYRVQVLHERGSRNEKELRQQIQKSSGAGGVAG